MAPMGTMAHGGPADPFTVRNLCQLIALAALLLALGLGAFASAVVPAKTAESIPAQLWIALRSCSLAALIMAPLQLLTAAAAMADTGLAQSLPLAPEVLRRTNFGMVWIAGIPLLLLLNAAVWWPGSSRTRAGVAAVLAAALLALHALVSHAIDFGSAAIICFFLHQTAAALWSGALVGLALLAWRGTFDSPATHMIVTRTSRLAGWCVALLVPTGIYVAYCALGLNLDHLLYSAYGRTLMLKVWVFGVALLLGGYNRYWLVPHISHSSVRNELMQSVCVECLLVVAVFALAVLLANTPPSH
jgi:putative copper resistance protein D